MEGRKHNQSTPANLLGRIQDELLHLGLRAGRIPLKRVRAGSAGGPGRLNLNRLSGAGRAARPGGGAKRAVPSPAPTARGRWASPALRAPAAATLALPAEPACALCQRAPREPVRADCGHRFCRACVVRFWAEEDGPFPCPECADDCWQRAVEPGRPPLSRRLLALEEAAAGPVRDGPASEAALQLLCRADGRPLCSTCRGAAGPEPPEWEPRWRKALRGKENKGSVEIMRKDLNDARDLHGQAESAAAVWKGHVMDRRKKALTDYRKLRAFFVEEEQHFLQEAEKEEGSPEDEDSDPAERFQSLLQAVSELEKRHHSLGLNMLLQSLFLISFLSFSSSRPLSPVPTVRRSPCTQVEAKETPSTAAASPSPPAPMVSITLGPPLGVDGPTFLRCPPWVRVPLPHVPASQAAGVHGRSLYGPSTEYIMFLHKAVSLPSLMDTRLYFLNRPEFMLGVNGPSLLSAAACSFAGISKRGR
ncbi:E3 ubiquitin-protein ligase RNF187 [Erinaceus europaeus]|uniref:E3 ubiquitin-protein ligase RNF187 n=1 Tax=Erinaceus europaeus TaxID=9365 RepID=A0ABM3XVQ4_ERIEU|nr:E3 ubiquitin-protein ligase RNF187 [Erinaceus europaeus]